ncbi:hypothetical protein OHA27_21855 [Streptomyces sp. NBC_01619]|uniref:hypothetical protein n=1 Tax=Streptomyces sp. NBC_01619 TaxID=2975901 RepID=UPI002255B299|nr:hypothetical protein [Streptomyces sp. NBC_01619]MCX4512903.1 hypothetical protein [Streptomyces sp. NBC_01619]
MHDREDAGSENEPFDPDDVLWVRGVDYLAGWRDATDAGSALMVALAAAGVDTTGLTWQASTAADGAGSLRVALPAAAARDVAALVRAVARLGRTG